VRGAILSELVSWEPQKFPVFAKITGTRISTMPNAAVEPGKGMFGENA